MKEEGKYNLLLKKIKEIDDQRKKLYLEKHTIEKENLAELYVGKFWKTYDNTFSYCKEDAHDEWGGRAVFDYFKIAVNDEGLEYETIFKKDVVDSPSTFCKTEITEKEFNEALEIFKNRFFAFIRNERKVLVEKSNL